MPSPFPGMDPYLEDPDVWLDFHAHLAAEIAAVLNGALPSSRYARLRRRVEHQIEPIQHRFIEIRDAKHGHAVVTVIEIASPSNKRSGPDRRAYLAKQREVLDSDANLIEIDLLRAGQRLLPDPALEAIVQQMEPVPDYLVCVHRAWKRSNGNLICQMFPIQLPDPLPCIAVPLREDVPVVALDLQYIMSRAFDRGPYLRGAIDYTQPPHPPLDGERAAWAEQCLHDFRASLQ